MTTLKTITEEEKKEFFDSLDRTAHRILYDKITAKQADELDKKAFTTAMQRAYEAGKADWLRSEIEKLDGEKLPYPYVCKSPFPGEGVDFHLKTYGHLPDFGCCKYDQLTKDETDVYNQAITSIITRYKEELKVLESKQ